MAINFSHVLSNVLATMQFLGQKQLPHKSYKAFNLVGIYTRIYTALAMKQIEEYGSVK